MLRESDLEPLAIRGSAWRGRGDLGNGAARATGRPSPFA